MTNKKYNRTVKDLKLLLDDLPKGLDNYAIIFLQESTDYIEVDEIDHKHEIIFLGGYYLNYN